MDEAEYGIEGHFYRICLRRVVAGRNQLVEVVNEEV